jgi:multidrug resistance efflux pump
MTRSLFKTKLWLFGTFLRRFLLWIITGLAVLIIGLVLLRKKDEAPLFFVNPGEFLIDIQVRGEVKSIDSYVISSPTNVWGNIRIVKMVPEGTLVSRDDFLIQFDTAEFLQRLQETQNNLENAIAGHDSKLANIKKQMADLDSQLQIEAYNLEQTRLRYKNAVYEAENKRKEIEYSLKKAEISYRQLQERIEATKNINEASLKQTQLQVDQARMKVQRQKEDLEKLTLTSPAEGLVVYREIWGTSGLEKVKVGSSPWRNQPLLEIPDQTKMKVVLQVNEVDISRLAVNQLVIIKLDAIPDTVFHGNVVVVAALAHEDPDSKKNVFEVEVNFSGSDERLKPGMSAFCQIIVERMDNVLFVPIDAIEIREGAPGVVLASGAFQRVKTGKSSSDFVVVEQGLVSGDAIRLRRESISQKELPGKGNQRSPEPRRSQQVRVIRHG